MLLVMMMMIDDQDGVLEDRWSEDYSLPRLDQQQQGGHNDEDKQLLEWVSKPSMPLLAFAFTMPVRRATNSLE
jgi:hypothetical protein